MIKTDLLTRHQDVVGETAIIRFKHKLYRKMKGIPQYKVIGHHNFDRIMHVIIKVML